MMDYFKIWDCDTEKQTCILPKSNREAEDISYGEVELEVSMMPSWDKVTEKT
jgi:hypothetical protein